MENPDLVLLVLVGGGMALLLLAAVIKYLVEFFDEIKYVKMEMNRAYDWAEYVYWRRELRALRWCIIPGMTMDRVRAIQRRFRRRKHLKKKDSDGFVSMLLPSVLGICICMVCLAGGTFAWFTATQDVSTQSIVAANYDIETTVMDGSTVLEPQNGTYKLEADKEYQVTLKATGTASTGYCIVKMNGEMFQPTVQFPTAKDGSKEITFTLDMKEGAVLSIEAQWGSSAWKNAKIENGGSYPYGETADVPVKVPDEDEKDTSGTDNTPKTTEKPAETEEPKLDPNVYTVQSGDTLGKIAKLYNTTVEKLAAYNNISDASLIYPGQPINIPPADWKIPETTAPAVTEPSTTEPADTEPPETTETTTEAGSETTSATETTVHEETSGTADTSEATDGAD